MTLIARIVCSFCVLLLAACSTTPPAGSPSGVATYVVVRHAEKTSDGSDPPLTAAGRSRADALAARLAAADVAAVYATDFLRTRDTAAPTASAHRVTVTAYAASMSPATFAALLRRAQPTGTVLVVGHSNTVPGIVAALCSCAVDPIDESDYGNLFEVHIDRNGGASIVRQRY